MADALFYYESNGQQAGPISASQLKALAVSGELKPTDMIWKEGTPDWVTAGSVRGLFPEGVLPPRPAAPPAPPTAGDMGRQAAAVAKEAAQQSIGAVKILLSDPVGGLGKAYEALGPSKALPVGIAFLVIYLLCYIISGIILSGSDLMVPWLSIKSYEPAMVMAVFGAGFQAGPFFQGLLLICLFVATLVGLSALFRMMATSTAGFAADLFIVGASLLPIGIVGLVLTIFLKILQPGWFGSVFYLGLLVAAHSVMIFILFSGLTKVIGISERAATAYMPGMFVAGVLVVAMLAHLINSGGSSGPNVKLPGVDIPVPKGFPFGDR